MIRGRHNGSLPRVIYWFPMPAPYMIDRFNALGRRGQVDFEAWFTNRREPHSSGPWEIDERTWEFPYRYVPGTLVRGRAFNFPPELLGASPPDLVVSPHGDPAYVAGWGATRVRRTRSAFWVVHTWETWHPRSAWKECLKAYMFPRTDAILTPGDDASGYARRYGASSERIIKVPHPVNSDFLDGDVRRAAAAEREQLRARLRLRGVTFIYVGRLWWGKGLTYLLDAFAAVQRTVPEPVSLMLVGDGPEEEILRTRVWELGLENVVFTGFRQGWQLPRYYAAADVFAFPSLGEPFGLVIGEAMAYGLPVVSTSTVGEIRDRVEEGGNGFVVESGGSESLSRAMLALVREPHLRKRMGVSSAAKAARWTPDRWAGNFESAVDQIFAMPKAQRG